jgi:hypothetical protein
MDIIKALGADPADVDFYGGAAGVAGYKITVHCPCAHCNGHNTTLDDEDALAPIIDACRGLRATRVAGVLDRAPILLYDYTKLFREVFKLRAEPRKLGEEAHDSK